MYVIAVEFTIHPQKLAAFMPLLLENARVSRETEPGCRRFDVCRDPVRPEQVFLYEIYDDRAAFDAHLAAAHFKAFDAMAVPMLAAKGVHAYELLNTVAA
jgi:quinol monooxygenase YgiN